MLGDARGMLRAATQAEVVILKLAYRAGVRVK